MNVWINGACILQATFCAMRWVGVSVSRVWRDVDCDDRRDRQDRNEKQSDQASQH